MSSPKTLILIVFLAYCGQTVALTSGGLQIWGPSWRDPVGKEANKLVETLEARANSFDDVPGDKKAANEEIDEISDNDASTVEGSPKTLFPGDVNQNENSVKQQPRTADNTEMQDELAEGVMDEFAQQEKKDAEENFDVKMGCRGRFGCEKRRLGK